MSNDNLNAHGSSDEATKELAQELSQTTSVEFQKIQIEQSIHVATATQQGTFNQPKPTIGESLGQNLAEAGIKATADVTVQYAAYNLLDTASKEAGAAFKRGDYQTGGAEVAKAGGAGAFLGAGVAFSAGTGTAMATIGWTFAAASGVGFVAGAVIFSGAFVWNRVRKNKK